MAKMTENARKVLDYLKAQGVGTPLTYKEVADALGFEKQAAVIGTIGSDRGGLVKKGLVEKFTETVEQEDGKLKEIKKFALTQAGAEFDPDSAEEE